MKKLIKLLPVFVGLLMSAFSYGQDLSSLSKADKSKLKTKHILFVVTSVGDVKATGHKTGLWIEEFVTPYYLLKDLNVKITVASPLGGLSPIDPRSEKPENSSDAIKRFHNDPAAQKVLNNTIALSDINPNDYDAVYYPGGHGPMWDMPDNAASIHLIETMYSAGKPISFVCHAPVALKNVKAPDGSLLIKGKKVSGFANTEERGGHTVEDVPFLLEDMLTANGANYVKGDDWKSFSVTDGLLITGQNPASSAAVIGRVAYALLNKK